MRTEQKELGWTTRAFFPDVTNIKNHEQSEEEAISVHLHKAKPLLEGALGILTAAGDKRCNHCDPARDLLIAFTDAMEMGETAFNGAYVHNQPPFITLDELGKILGDRGQAEVTIRITGEGWTPHKMVRIGHDYSVKAEKTA